MPDYLTTAALRNLPDGTPVMIAWPMETRERRYDVCRLGGVLCVDAAPQHQFVQPVGSVGTLWTQTRVRLAEVHKQRKRA